MSLWNDEELRKLFLSETPLIDVRAPVEFLEGAVPYSVNLPIINDYERMLIGTCYKERGQAEAIKLGHELVHGDLKTQRIDSWNDYVSRNPRSQIFCFRGGMRSQLSCQWLSERGINKTPIPGGYKRLRAFFLSYLVDGPDPQLFRLGGGTGSGKTNLIKEIKNSIDLESIANHRGSSFGSMGDQPSQITFENQLSLKLMIHENKKTLIEDESITIGKCTLPNRFFKIMREAPLINLVCSLEERIENIFQEYVRNNEAGFFLQGLERIKKRLSGSIYTTVKEEIEKSFSQGLNHLDHSLWISLLLEHYYDPLYQKDLKNQASLIVFQGNKSEVSEYFKSL